MYFIKCSSIGIHLNGGRSVIGVGRLGREEDFRAKCHSNHIIQALCFVNMTSPLDIEFGLPV